MTIIKESSVSTDLQTNPVPFFSVDSIVRALRECIISENSAINMYQKMADSILLVKWDDEQKHTLVRVIEEITDEEKVHIGELQKLLTLLDKGEVEFYKQGVEEV